MSFQLEGANGINLVIAQGATAGAALTGLSGAATTYSTSAVAVVIAGVPSGKAAVAGGASPTTDGNSGAIMTLVASQAAAFVWGVDGSGTVKVYKGPTIAWNGSDVTGLPFPYVPSTIAVIGVHAIKAGSTTVGTWQFGSSNWNATGISAITVTHCAGAMPTAPLTT